MNTDETHQKVSLGCGSLILIALIVLIFGGNSSEGMMRMQMLEMKSEIQLLSNEIKELRKALEKNQP